MNFSINLTRYWKQESYVSRIATSEESFVEHIQQLALAMWAYTPNFNHVTDVEIIIESEDWTFSFSWSSTDYEDYRDYISNMHSIIKLNY